jgi:hypothetical protein
MSASLKLFGVVLENRAPQPIRKTDFIFIREFGIVIAPNASAKAVDIRVWADKSELTGNQLNASFHKSWQKVLTASGFELAMEQLLHYLSTYGLESLGLSHPDLIYIPNEVLNTLEPLPLRVIRGVSRDELISRTFKLLSSGAALKQETISLAFDLLDELDYVFTGSEDIHNREAKVYAIERTGILPTNPMDLFRWFVYKATGETLLIKNDALIEKIKNSGYTLPDLSDFQQTTLAAHFNRLKPLWLAFKHSDANNPAIVNSISKLSKKVHKPLAVNLLNNVSKVNTAAEFSATFPSATIFQLVRAFNHLMVRLSSDNDAQLYLVRNGKGFAKEKPTKRSVIFYETLATLLLQEIRARFTYEKIYVPQNVDYAIPTSEKQFVGMIPINTEIRIPKGESFGLVGIYWEDGQERTDLDLRADSTSDSVGWNSMYRNTNEDFEGIAHSGDVTAAPQGASEWLYHNKITDTYSVKINSYSADENHPFKLIVGYGDNVKKDYVIDPNRVIFKADLSMVQEEITLGILAPTENGSSFYLSGAATGNRSVGRDNRISQIARQALIKQTKNVLRLSDLLALTDGSALSPEEAKYDLTPVSLTKDSFLNLFTH